LSHNAPYGDEPQLLEFDTNAPPSIKSLVKWFKSLTLECWMQIEHDIERKLVDGTTNHAWAGVKNGARGLLELLEAGEKIDLTACTTSLRRIYMMAKAQTADQLRTALRNEPDHSKPSITQALKGTSGYGESTAG
jgi:hypothetical protein